MKASKEVILVADYSKFNRRSFVFFAGWQRVNTVITSKGIVKRDLENLRKKGLKVLI